MLIKNVIFIISVKSIYMHGLSSLLLAELSATDQAVHGPSSPAIIRSAEIMRNSLLKNWGYHNVDFKNRRN